MYKYLWFYGTKPVDSTATILPSNKEVFVKQNQSVLDAALEAGLDWPHDCKFGTCGQCKCKLVKGKIKPTSDYSYTLTKEELKEATDLLFEKVKLDKVKVKIFKKYKLEDVIQAHTDLENRKIIGPAIIKPTK